VAHREGRSDVGDELRGGGDVGVVVVRDEERYLLAEFGEENVVLQHVHRHPASSPPLFYCASGAVADAVRRRR
jgi:hypothetical protein